MKEDINNHNTIYSSPELTINPELPIGTELWIIENNRAKECIVSYFKIIVTSLTDINECWFRQLINRKHHKKNAGVYKYHFTYYMLVGLEGGHRMIEKSKGKWYYSNRKRIYLSKDELIKDM